MMAVSNSVVIDLVSSDDEDAPSPRARRRGLSGRESRQSSRTIPPEPAPIFGAPVPAAARALRPAAQTAAHRPDLAFQDDAVGGANVFEVEGAGFEDMLNFDDFFDIPGGYPQDRIPAAATVRPSPPPQGQVIVIDGEDVFIPDSPPIRPVPAREPRPGIEEQNAMYALESANFTADVCLKRVLAMFPDIDHEHVIKLYNDYDAQGTEALPGEARLEAIVEKLLSGKNYPRQAKPTTHRKRKREDDGTDQEAKRWEGPDREAAGPAFKGAMASILKVEFPEITRAAITKELNTHHHLYPSYIALAQMKDSSDASKKWTGRPSKNLITADSLATHCGWPAMLDELEAARKHVKTLRRKRVIEDAERWVEKENLQRAIAANETAECQACFDDLPMNRQIHCDGNTAHFTCFDCATAYVKSEVGDSRCKVLCTAGCGAAFARAQLHLLKDKELLEKLEQLQQEKDIRDAALDNLEECPFCDYKAILPPIEEDFEFRCANEQCEKVSCRRCKAVSHIPLSCEEHAEQHAKDHKLSSRHKIEEAMTKALIRNCAKCSKAFIKEYGCNKMSCPSCGNLQCYVCSQSLKDYNHFDQSPRGLLGAKSSKCPLYDNVEERHEREVKEAEAAARAEVITENPDVTEQDLEIKLSDAVKKATNERVKRAGAVPGGIPPGFGGFAAARFPAMQQAGNRHRLQDRYNAMEAAILDGEEGAGRHRLDLDRLAGRFAAVENAIGLRDVPNNRPARNAAPVPGGDQALRGGIDVFAAANRPRPLSPDRQQPPPRGGPGFQPIPGGFNEDPFGGGDDGDPFDLHRLMFGAPRPQAQLVPAVPAVPTMPANAQQARRAGPNLVGQANQDRVRQLQQRMALLRNQQLRLARPQAQQPPQQVPAQQPTQQVPTRQQQRLNEAEQLRQLEARTRVARQRLNGGMEVQELEARMRWPRQRLNVNNGIGGQHPRRYHEPEGLPEQN